MEENVVQPVVPNSNVEEGEGFRAVIEFYASRVDGKDNYVLEVEGRVSNKIYRVSTILANPTDFTDRETAKFIQDVEKEVYAPIFNNRLTLNTRNLLFCADDLFEDTEIYTNSVVVDVDANFSHVEANKSINGSCFQQAEMAISRFSGKWEEVISLPITPSAFAYLLRMFANEPLLADKSLLDFTETSIHELEKALKEEKEANDHEKN